MFYKITNSTDLQCLIHHLKITVPPNGIQNMAPVLEHINFTIDTLEKAYRGNEDSELRGGYVAFFSSANSQSLEYSKKMLLLRYHLEEDDCEFDDVLTTITSGNTYITWHSKLYILSDYQIVIIFPTIEERRA